MAEETKNPRVDTQMPKPHHKILGQTLGSLLKENTGARETVIKAMRITPEQFEEMLTSAETNPLMQMTIGELFKNGIVQKAVGEKNVPLSPEQITALENEEPVMHKKVYTKEKENKSIIERIKSWF
jgi:hypothetical protein